MFTELYIEALLTNPDMADQVWELWDVGVIPDGLAAWAWSQTVEQSLLNCGSTHYS